MPSNVEIKARVQDIDNLKRLAKSLSESEGVILKQEDVFFNVPHGRLKLRKIQGSFSELIFYDRPDQEGPKFSDYSKTNVDDPTSLQDTLSKALGVKGIVTKTRTLYMVGQTRVHVDQVNGLGNFMELEVMMKEGQSVGEGEGIAKDLMVKLGVKNNDLISCAYMDLILNKITI
ncbi:hypothetical protein FSP39_025140 [Pinctada imbricata]|uniref:CYTH domain-containing protein n=1 Tax=Pinctada imbricata TaxID=66713 RepID=A0AA89C7L9_PINIB|nr:hypothetical protein FSP39_025140 [Pinctada imbricata]